MKKILVFLGLVIILFLMGYFGFLKTVFIKSDFFKPSKVAAQGLGLPFGGQFAVIYCNEGCVIKSTGLVGGPPAAKNISLLVRGCFTRYQWYTPMEGGYAVGTYQRGGGNCKIGQYSGPDYDGTVQMMGTSQL